MTELEYIAYFEFLAANLREIQHSPQKPAFFVVKDDNFAEVQQAVRNMVLPVLLLDQYIDDLKTDNDNNRLLIKGGFSVLCSFEDGDTEAQRLARDLARQIALKAVKRVRKDVLYGPSRLKKYAILPGTVYNGDPTPVVIGNATGWSYGFDWTMPISAAVDPSDWIDLSDPAP